MFGYELKALLVVALLPASTLLALICFRRYNLLVRTTIGIGLFSALLACWSLAAGRMEASGIFLVAAAVGLGLAAIAGKVAT